MNLGELIEQLAKLPPTSHVYVEGGPVALGVEGAESYRGYYEDLAINVGPTRYAKFSLVKDLWALLRDKIGTSITGYKGGAYTVTRETRVWISNYGECSGSRVTGAKLRLAYDGDEAVALTWEREG